MRDELARLSLAPGRSAVAVAVPVDARDRTRLPAAMEAPHADGSLAVGGPGDDDDAEVVPGRGAPERKSFDSMAAHAPYAAAVDVGVHAHDPAAARLVDAEREAV